MSREDVERVDDAGIAAWDGHDTEGFVALLADDFVWTDVTVPEPMRTKDQAREYAQAWFTAFPDLQVKETNRIIDGDSFAAELEFRGTHTGPLAMAGNEVPATGRSVVGVGSYFGRIRDGKLVEFSTHPDVAGMMMQLGLIGG